VGPASITQVDHLLATAHDQKLGDDNDDYLFDKDDSKIRSEIQLIMENYASPKAMGKTT